MVQTQSPLVEETKKEVVIVGSRGLLGKALFAEASKYFKTTGLTHDDLDITDGNRVLEVLCSLKPEIILLTAAYTDVDGCEENPSLAYRVNVEGTRNVASAARQLGSTLIYFSTDCVFNGRRSVPYREDDETDPISVYGRTKLEGEKAVQTALAKYVIIRTVWLFGETQKGFVPAVLKAIEQKTPFRVVTDKIGSLTYAVDLSQAICQIMRLILAGQYDFQRGCVLHITNGGSCTWWEIGQFIIDYFKEDLELIPMVLSEFPFKAKRPPYSALANTRFEQITLRRLRPWPEALKEYLQCRKT